MSLLKVIPDSFGRCNLNIQGHVKAFAIDNSCKSVFIRSGAPDNIVLNFDRGTDDCQMVAASRGQMYIMDPLCKSLKLSLPSAGRLGVDVSRTKKSIQGKKSISSSPVNVTSLPLVEDVKETAEVPVSMGTGYLGVCPKAEIDYDAIGEFWTIAFVSVCMLYFTARGMNILVNMVRCA